MPAIMWCHPLLTLKIPIVSKGMTQLGLLGLSNGKYFPSNLLAEYSYYVGGKGDHFSVFQENLVIEILFDYHIN